MIAVTSKTSFGYIGASDGFVDARNGALQRERVTWFGCNDVYGSTEGSHGGGVTPDSRKGNKVREFCKIKQFMGLSEFIFIMDS